MGTDIEKFEKLEEAAKLFLKGYSIAEISRELDISRALSKKYIDEYKEFVKGRAMEDPEFLDRLVENTLEVLDEINLVKKEVWQVFESAKNLDMINSQVQSLKLVSETIEKEAKLLQLMGVKTDGGNMARLARAEHVNEIVSGVVKDIISQCPNCKHEAQIRLAEAFNLMGKQNDIVDAELINED